MKRHLPFLLCLPLPIVAVYDLSATIPWPILFGYWLLLSLTTYGNYWEDKRRAQADRWRIPERTLHTFAFLGGWPAAYVAQQIHRHKTKKRSFQIVFWCIVDLHQSIALDSLIDWKIAGGLRRS